MAGLAATASAQGSCVVQLRCHSDASSSTRAESTVVSLSSFLGSRLSLSQKLATPVGRRGSRLAVAAVAVEDRPAEAAAPAASLPTGLLDGKDPAWKLGTAQKARLKAYYETAVVPALTAEFGYKNPQEVPQVQKIVINCGIGDASQSAKTLESASKDLALVTGQRPVVTRARKAIAGFKLREGVPVGMATTLRGQVMYAYLDRLLNLALPRVRDFRGVSRGGFDGRGNYSMGLSEQTMFPEIQFDQIDKARGMDISIVTTAPTDREAQRLLELLGMPFKEGPAPVKVPKVKGGRGRGGRGGGKGASRGNQKTKSKKK